MELETLVQDLRPDHTILLFGAGSSIPSNAPTSQQIIDHLSKVFSLPCEGFSLSEFTELVERRTSNRRRMISEIRSLFKKARPTSGLLNLPIYDWKAIYTTNYDNLIEEAYRKKSKEISVYTSNFDFGSVSPSSQTRLYKMHGTIDQDVSFGNHSRIIITESDYNVAQEYRDHLFTALQHDLAESFLVIIGSSLSDNDIKPLISRAIQLNSKAMIGGRITLLMYNRDEARADIYRGQGINVVFGGIDEFFACLAKQSPGPLFDYQPSDSVIENFVKLVPTLTDVRHQIETAQPDVSRMFAGWPANYADIDVTP